MNLKTLKNLAAVALLATLASCSGSGSCPPTSQNLSLAIKAPSQYPAGVPLTITLTMKNF